MSTCPGLRVESKCNRILRKFTTILFFQKRRPNRNSYLLLIQVTSAKVDDYIPDMTEDLQHLQKQKQYENYRQTQPINQGVIPMMLRMVGLDEQKLGMMALNMLVYLAEYIAKNFMGMESEFQNEIPQYR